MTGSTYIQEINLTIRSNDRKMLEELRASAYGDLDTMIKSGVFNFKNGVAELHRDSDGKLRSVNVKQITFKV